MYIESAHVEPEIMRNSFEIRAEANFPQIDILIYDKYSSTSFKTASMAEKNCFDMTKLFFEIMCVTVVQWSRSCLHVQINRVRLPATVTLLSFSLSHRFFLFGPCFLTLFFPFGPFSFIFTADHADHELGSIYISSLGPEFCFGKGISKALDLHTDQAYDQKKDHKLSRHVPPLKQLNVFQCS